MKRGGKKSKPLSQKKKKKKNNTPPESSNTQIKMQSPVSQFGSLFTTSQVENKAGRMVQNYEK